jgi:hypothetical protein
MIPADLDGVPTDVLEIGKIRAFLTPTDRWRPAPGGVSIGHYRITAGTLGLFVCDRASGTRLILSNNHVLAKSNDAAVAEGLIENFDFECVIADRSYDSDEFLQKIAEKDAVAVIPPERTAKINVNMITISTKNDIWSSVSSTKSSIIVVSSQGLRSWISICSAFSVLLAH